MIYLDTSCLLKLLRLEASSAAVRSSIQFESIVVISSLAELEAQIGLNAMAEGGEIRTAQLRQFQAGLVRLKNFDPFQWKPLAGTIFSTALRQTLAANASYCRTLDRLHLAAMEELGLPRLMTLDKTQAKAARALGFEVVEPK